MWEGRVWVSVTLHFMGDPDTYYWVKNQWTKPFHVSFATLKLYLLCSINGILIAPSSHHYSLLNEYYFRQIQVVSSCYNSGPEA